MSENRRAVSPARLHAAPAYIAFLMLAVGTISFVDNRLFSSITGYLGLALPVDSLVAGLAVVPVALAVASLRRWNDRTLKAVMYLSLALYLPAVAGLSRVDLLKLAGYSFNFDAFSGSLPPVAVAVSGILLACGGLLLRSFSYAKAARASFTGRGALPDEVDLALYRQTLLEAKIIGATAVTVLVVILGVTLLEPALQLLLQSAKFAYVLAGLAAALALGTVLLVYLRSVKR